MSVKDLMTQEPHFVSEKTTILDAAKSMSRLKIGSVIVGSPAKIMGIISEKDLVEKVIVLGLSPESTSVKEIMTHNVVTVDDNKSDHYALALMIAREIRHLPIIDKAGICTGIVSLRDLVKPVVRKFEKKDDSIYLTDDYEKY